MKTGYFIVLFFFEYQNIILYPQISTKKRCFHKMQLQTVQALMFLSEIKQH